MKELCQIIIYHINDTEDFQAKLTGLGQWATFNPLYLLPDICTNNGEFNFFNYEFSNTISLENILKFKNEQRTQYRAVLNGIEFLMKKSNEKQSEIKPEHIEILRPYFDITFKFTPIAKVTNPSSNSFPPIHHSSFSIEEVLQKKESLYYDYFYQCYSPSDILFSVLHFLALNKYKFRTCNHCGKYFATTNLKKQYCNRFSEYPGYEKYDCYNAVKRIRQEIQRKHVRIKNNLNQYYMPEKLEDFEKQFNELIDDLKEHSDYTIIEKCFELLDKKKWYVKDSIRTIGWKEK